MQTVCQLLKKIDIIYILLSKYCFSPCNSKITGNNSLNLYKTLIIQVQNKKFAQKSILKMGKYFPFSPELQNIPTRHIKIIDRKSENPAAHSKWQHE
jgi:hypothetical protein